MQIAIKPRHETPTKVRTNKRRPSKADFPLCCIQVVFCLSTGDCDTIQTSEGQSFLLNYFWVRWTAAWGGVGLGGGLMLNRIIKLYQLCDTPPSAAGWKAMHFHAPSKPLTCHEKIWHQSWQKHKGEMNDAIVAGKHQSCSILWGKQCIFCLHFRGDKQHLWLA